MNLSHNNSELKRRVAIYIRVSTQEQEVEWFWLEAQKSKLLDYVENNRALNLTTKPEWFFSDVSTWSDLNRPWFKKLMEEVQQNKFDAVLVWKIDRLSRSLKHLLSTFEELKKHQVSFISVQENIDFKWPIWQLIFQMFWAIAQFERELIKWRTMMWKIMSAEMWNYTGAHIPYWYKEVKNSNGRGKKLAILPEESKWVKEIFKWYIYEWMWFRQIMNRLNEYKIPKWKGLKTKKQYTPWNEKQIQKMLSNNIYRWEYVANRNDENWVQMSEDKWTVVNIPACISDLVFYQAKNIRENRVSWNMSEKYLLSWKVIDISVNPPRKFTWVQRSKWWISYKRKQFDREWEHYTVFETPWKQLEEYTWKKILEALWNPEVFIQNYINKSETWETKINLLKEQLNLLKEKEINIWIAIWRVEMAYENWTYSEEKMSDKVMQKDKELSEISLKIKEIEKELSFIISIDLEISKLREASEQVKYKLDNLSHANKKIICQLFIDRIELHREEKPSSGIRKKRDINATIYFKFDPKGLSNKLEVVRTTQAPKLNKKDPKGSPENLSGGDRGYRTLVQKCKTPSSTCLF